MSEIKPREETSFANIDLFYFSNFFFKKNHCFIEKATLQKNVWVEEELDCIDIDGIGELTRSINQKKKSDVFTVVY